MAEFKPPRYGLTEKQFALATSSGPLANPGERTKLFNLLEKRKKDWEDKQTEMSSTPSASTTTVPVSTTAATTTTIPSPTTTAEWSPEASTPSDSSGGQSGTVTQDYQVYATSKFNEAYVALRNMSLDKRLETLKTLRQKGFGGGAEVSGSGISETDINRYKELLILQDVSNLTMKDLWGKVNSMDSAISTVASRRTPIKDVDSIFDEVMKRDLGRGATKQELEKFRAAYSGMEAGGNAPSLTAAAESQVETANPEETEAARFAEYAATFEKMLRGA
jgi:hypothetical protein